MIRSIRTEPYRQLLLALVAVAVLTLLAPLSAWAKPTTTEDARKVVSGWLQVDRAPLDEAMPSNVTGVETVHGAAGEIVYYVVSLAPEGFVIVSADDLVEPIIAFQASGSFKDAKGSPLEAMLSGDMPARMARVAKQEAASDTDDTNLRAQERASRQRWTRFMQAHASAASGRGSVQGSSSITDVRVAPLMGSTWGQRTVLGLNTYNYYTPNNYYSGCVATSLGQLMRYHQYPTTGVGTAQYAIKVNNTQFWRNLRGGDGSGGPYAWGSMPLSPGNGITTVQRQAIGALVHDAGVASHMNYTSSGSGASITDAAVALLSVFDYSNTRRIDTWSNLSSTTRNKMIYPNLDAGLPVILGINGSTGGHAVVADGYGFSGSTLYAHINMGWDGYADMWYNLPTITGAGFSFTAVWSIIYNIYTTGTGEIISGRALDQSDQPVSGVTVTITGSGVNRQAVTNDKGIYAFAKLPSNSDYTISASKNGYFFPARSVTIGTSVNGGATPGNIWQFDLSSSPTGVSPVGDISNQYPEFSWPAVPRAEYYQLLIKTTSNVTRHRQWHKAEDITTNGVCKVPSPFSHADGSYNWWVLPWNPNGTGPWSNNIFYTVDGPDKPDTATLLTPDSSVNTYTPTFSWKHVPRATYYLLQINRGTTRLYRGWHRAVDVVEGATISVESPKYLASGTYLAWVMPWNPNGSGTWSDVVEFTVSAPYTSTRLQITGPTGTVDTMAPTFTWDADANATHYLLQVNKGANKIFREWLKVEDVDQNDGTCAAVSPKDLPPGALYAWVRPWNANNGGVWSDAHSFSVASYSAPGKAVLTGPAAEVSDFFPVLTWDEVPGANYYQVLIYKAYKGNYLRKWYKDEDVCSNGTCSLTSPTGHGNGSYGAWVQPFNPAGYGTWSDYRPYTVNAGSVPDKPF